MHLYMHYIFMTNKKLSLTLSVLSSCQFLCMVLKICNKNVMYV